MTRLTELCNPILRAPGIPDEWPPCPLGICLGVTRWRFRSMLRPSHPSPTDCRPTQVLLEIGNRNVPPIDHAGARVGWEGNNQTEGGQDRPGYPVATRPYQRASIKPTRNAIAND
jgi:hypothetical protein